MSKECKINNSFVPSNQTSFITLYFMECGEVMAGDMDARLHLDMCKGKKEK